MQTDIGDPRSDFLARRLQSIAAMFRWVTILLTVCAVLDVSPARAQPRGAAASMGGPPRVRMTGPPTEHNRTHRTKAAFRGGHSRGPNSATERALNQLEHQGPTTLADRFREAAANASREGHHVFAHAVGRGAFRAAQATAKWLKNIKNKGELPTAKGLVKGMGSLARGARRMLFAASFYVLVRYVLSIHEWTINKPLQAQAAARAEREQSRARRAELWGKAKGAADRVLKFFRKHERAEEQASADLEALQRMDPSRSDLGAHGAGTYQQKMEAQQALVDGLRREREQLDPVKLAASQVPSEPQDNVVALPTGPARDERLRDIRGQQQGNMEAHQQKAHNAAVLSNMRSNAPAGSREIRVAD